MAEVNLFQELSEEEVQQARSLAASFDLRDALTSAQFGAGIQRRLAEEAARVFERIQQDRPDAQRVLSRIEQLSTSLDFDFNEQKPGFFGRLFSKGSVDIEHLEDKVEQAGMQMDQLAGELDLQRLQLLRDIGVLEQLQERLLTQVLNLDMLLYAGQVALDSFVPKDEDDTRAKERFEQSLHNLRVSRLVAMQTAPQISLMQDNNRALSSLMHTTISQTIPVWRNQLTLLLAQKHQQQALRTRRRVDTKAAQSMKEHSAQLIEQTRNLRYENTKDQVMAGQAQSAQEALSQAVQDALQLLKDNRARRAQAEQSLQQTSIE